MQKPVLYLMVGLPRAGKTTRAKEIENKYNVIRFTPDEWILDLYDHRLDKPHMDEVRNQVEQLQWGLAQRLLAQGQSVILDWGFWSAKEREKYRQEAKDLGASVKTEFLDESIDEMWARASKRPENQSGTLHFTREDLEEWATRFEPPTYKELSAE